MTFRGSGQRGHRGNVARDKLFPPYLRERGLESVAGDLDRALARIVPAAFPESTAATFVRTAVSVLALSTALADTGQLVKPLIAAVARPCKAKMRPFPRG